LTFKKGHPGGPGRPKGSQDKYTKIKEMILDVVQNRSSELDDVNLKDLLTFVGKTAPKDDSLNVKQEVIIRWEGDDDNVTS